LTCTLHSTGSARQIKTAIPSASVGTDCGTVKKARVTQTSTADLETANGAVTTKVWQVFDGWTLEKNTKKC